jgi:hypothetical protein
MKKLTMIKIGELPKILTRLYSSFTLSHVIPLITFPNEGKKGDEEKVRKQYLISIPNVIQVIDRRFFGNIKPLVYLHKTSSA